MEQLDRLTALEAGVLRSLIDLFPAGIVVNDAEGNVVLSNAIANELLGDLLAASPSESLQPYTLHRLDGSPFNRSALPVPRAIHEGATTKDEIIIIRRENQPERIILAAASPRYDNDGHIVGAVSVVQDITERERIARSVREHEERLSLITSSSPDTMFYQDANRRFQWIVNPALPYDVSFVGKTDEELPNVDQVEELIALKQKVLATGVGGRIDVLIGHGADERYLEMVIEPRRDEKGTVTGLFGYSRDVTDRVRAKQELARLNHDLELERSRLQAIFQSAINPIMYVDAKTGRLEANPEAEALFGRPLSPEKGREQIADTARTAEGTAIPFADLPSARIFRGETPVRQELLVVRSDGSSVPVVENAAAVHAADGSIAGAVVIFQDISALKELERLRNEWTSIIAHDLRQPINVITGYASALASEIAPQGGRRRSRMARIRPWADRILASSHHLNRMVADLLEYSRIETRRLTVERQTVDAAALIRDAVGRASDTTGGHAVNVQIRGDAPSVEADPDRIDQVIFNLLSNAAKYGEPNSPIDVEVEPDTADVRVTVANRGPAIPPTELKSIFNRFARTSTGSSRRPSGLGLGLYICRGIVEAHGGRIWAESPPGGITYFRFTLPIAAPS
jgi:PAS domain S-box-containing protein